tara:strand:- start:359 stop:871 length:513 start_codon:yes stop_codon:yes gene_type:complete
MNELQKFIFKIIVNIFELDHIEKFYKKSEIRYGILNYVAKYSLARDKYYITKECLNHLNKLNLITKQGLRRGSKSKKNQFTYEHPIPSNVIADELFDNRDNPEIMKKILIWSDVVTVLTSKEDELLMRSYRSKMPLKWNFFKHDKFERYKICGIENPPSLEINVFGSVQR